MPLHQQRSTNPMVAQADSSATHFLWWPRDDWTRDLHEWTVGLPVHAATSYFNKAAPSLIAGRFLDFVL